LLNHILQEENFKVEKIKLPNETKEKDLETLFKDHMASMDSKINGFDSNMRTLKTQIKDKTSTIYRNMESVRNDLRSNH
jgi:methyl-accepting chemotaxis protein